MGTLGDTLPVHLEIDKITPNVILNQVPPWIKMPKEQLLEIIGEI